ncbi:MAG: hypothetical protein M3412_04490 [Chloroflexota bacterium]|nr:hypothetical protein [Chloroflexota bacterium]
MATTTHKHHRASTPDSLDLSEIGRRIWDNLPLLLFIGLVLAASVLPVLLVASAGLAIVAFPVAVLTCGPVWAGIVAAADRLNLDAPVSVKAFFRLVCQHAVAGILVTLVPALLATALLGTISLWATNPESRWLLLPLLLDCSLAILVLASGVAVYSLATTSGLRGWNLWRASLAVAVASPLATVGSLTLFALSGLLLSHLAPLLLPVILAPFAVLSSAITWSTVNRHAPIA